MKNLLFILLAFLCAESFSQPVINSFTPEVGPVGSSVVINGSNFSATAVDNVVYFGAVRAIISSASASSLTVVVPVGATYQPISVTSNSLTGYSRKPFVVTFPGGMAITNNVDGSQNSFAAKVDFTTDLHPNGIALGDFDGDGKPDVATPNNYSTAGSLASISILRNTSSNGSVSFASKSDITTGVLTYAIAAGDLNGDGKIDLISSSIVDKTISIFKNISSVAAIAFDTKIDFATGENPYSIAVSDIDNDGKPDIVVANYLSNTVSVFRNTSAGGAISFASRIDFLTALAPYTVAVADFDSDGKTDVAVTNQFSNSISVFKNTSVPGTISMNSKVDFATGGSPMGLAAGDINNDGLMDLVAANNGTASFSVLRNTNSTGTISFAAKVDFSCASSPYTVSLGDLNGDGQVDIVIPSANLSVHQNSSAGATISMAGRAFLYLSPEAYIVGITDIDGDGKGDLSGAIFTGTKVSVLRNTNNHASVRSFTPASAATGATVTITGNNFSSATAVSFGGAPASSFAVVNSSTISAVVGSGYSGDVSVTNPYGTGSLAGFVFKGAPVITSFSPAAAGYGSTVTLTGANLTGATTVNFGGIPASSFTNVSPTGITAVVGTGSTGNVSVVTPYGTATVAGFQYVPAPTITSITPAAASVGGSVTITGTNFSGATAVSFGGVAASSFVVVSANTITAVVGPGASGNVSVTTPGGTASISGFSLLPTVSSFSPAAAGIGTTVTISGSNFTGVTGVRFGGVAATAFNVVSATTITAVVGGGASGNVSVTTSAGSVSLPGFSFIPAPLINSFTPLFGGNGSVVTITGSNFNSASNVSFGGTAAASFTVVSSTSIVAVVAAGSTGDVTVKTAGGTATQGSFKFYTAPVITSFSPTSGPAGTTVTITGANFNNIAANNIVSFGTLKGQVISGSSNSISVVVPVGASFHPVTVTTNNLTASSSKPFVVTFPGLSTFTAGSFSAKIDFIAGKNPSAIAMSDLDDDGKADVAVTNHKDNTVSVYKNSSSSSTISFAGKQDFNAGSRPHHIVLHDIDGDGKSDIILLNRDSIGYLSGGSNTISILKNVSTGGNLNFNSRVTFTPANAPSAIGVSDFDGDGKPDIVVSMTGVSFNGHEYVGVFRNTTSGGTISFDPMQYFVATALSSTDFYRPNNIAIGDINGDGASDIVVGTDDTFFSVLKNQSQPGIMKFATQDIGFYIGAGSFKDVTVADFDNDGKADVITNDYIFRNVSSVSTISFDLVRLIGIGGKSVASDFNGDGSPDLAIAEFSMVSVEKDVSTTGSISFAPKVNYTTGSNTWGIFAADVDGDGRPEIATANYDDNIFSILKNQIQSLPAKLLNFSATPIQESVRLDWKTANEQNSSAFIIEHGVNVQDLKPLFTEPAIGAGTNSYVHLHTKPATGRNYYRLKMIDKDGTFVYTNILSINFDKKDFTVKVYPNPAHQFVYVEYPAMAADSEMTIMDVGGRPVKRVHLPGNSSFIKVDVKGLAAGMYTLAIPGSNSRTSFMMN
jgi:hypothetical protein